MKNKAIITSQKVTQLDGFEKDILIEVLEGTNFSIEGVKNLGQIGSQYLYEYIDDNRKFLIKILLDENLSFDKETEVLNKLYNSACAPNIFLEKTKPYKTLILECPKAKFYADFEGVKNNEKLPLILKHLHECLAISTSEQIEVETFDFFKAFELLENRSTKLKEFVHELRRRYVKQIKNLPPKYTVSCFNFTPFTTLYNGNLFMPIEWSNPKNINCWLEVGSVFLFFDCKNFKDFSQRYCGENNFDEKKILSVAAIHNLAYSLLLYSFVSSGININFGIENARKLLKKSFKDVFDFCDLPAEMVNKVKILIKNEA